MKESQNIAFRRARLSDLDDIIALISEDELGSKRESGELNDYKSVFLAIENSEFTAIYVMLLDDLCIGCFQIMFLPHISFTGTKRAQVESVRIKKEFRGHGYGSQLMQFSIDLARENQCGIYQLTSNKNRIEETHKFYRSLGLTPSHEGYKLML